MSGLDGAVRGVLRMAAAFGPLVRIDDGPDRGLWASARCLARDASRFGTTDATARQLVTLGLARIETRAIDVDGVTAPRQALEITDAGRRAAAVNTVR